MLNAAPPTVGLDPGAFESRAVAPETVAVNDALRQAPAIPLDILEIRRQMEQTAKAMAPGGVPYRSERAEEVSFDAGRSPMRVIAPRAGRAGAAGVYIHAHGGGWSFGSAADTDAALESLADATGYVVASIEYRLAPEFPFPTPLDDVATALRFALAGGLGVPGPVVAGGESSGANLVVASVLRERDSGNPVPAGMVLFYGAYDLTGTPSSRSFGTGLGMVDSESLPYFYDLYAGGRALDDPAVSPLYAGLADLPPTLLLVGTRDPLLDDSMFLWARLRAAGVRADLHLAPGAAHGFNFFPGPAGAAAVAAQQQFLGSIDVTR